jgi:hypothetical protein
MTMSPQSRPQSPNRLKNSSQTWNISGETLLVDARISA